MKANVVVGLDASAAADVEGPRCAQIFPWNRAPQLRPLKWGLHLKPLILRLLRWVLLLRVDASVETTAPATPVSVESERKMTAFEAEDDGLVIL